MRVMQMDAVRYRPVSEQGDGGSRITGCTQLVRMAYFHDQQQIGGAKLVVTQISSGVGREIQPQRLGSSDGFDCLIFLSLLIMLVCLLSWGA